ncbi:MAG: hypothetical protein Q9182_006372 [Xanthomendoza sp. 2 TL-2023]
MTSKVINSRICFLTVEQVTKLHQIYIAPTTPYRASLLGSAIDAPMNIKHYQGEQDVVKLVAILATRIIKNSAFNDGNKRTSLLAASVFLKINGKMLHEKPLETKDSKAKEILEAAHSAVAISQCDEAGLAEEYGKVLTDTTITAEIESMRENALEY